MLNCLPILTANPGWSTGGKLVGHMAEPCAGCILQAASMKDFTREGRGCSAAFSAPLSPALLASISCQTLPEQGQPCQAPGDRAALEGQHLFARAGGVWHGNVAKWHRPR